MTAVDQIVGFLRRWPDAEYGPAHIVLSDHNLTDVDIKHCLGLARAALSGDERDLVAPRILVQQLQIPDWSTKLVEAGDVQLMNRVDWYRDHDREELQATIAFLELLLAIPEAERDVDD